jgi:hypothetical protein
VDYKNVLNKTQTVGIKYLRSVKGCTTTDTLKNVDVKTELGFSPLQDNTV